MPGEHRVYNLEVETEHCFFAGRAEVLSHNTEPCLGNFDKARREALEKAGMTNPEDIKFTKIYPETGTVVEFKGKDGAKVAYDEPHDSPGPHHNTPHVGWQTGGKRGSGGAERGNIPYEGQQHPSRSNIKGEGDVEPH